MQLVLSGGSIQGIGSEMDSGAMMVRIGIRGCSIDHGSPVLSSVQPVTCRTLAQRGARTDELGLKGFSGLQGSEFQSSCV